MLKPTEDIAQKILFFLLTSLLLTTSLRAQDPADPAALKRLTIEELMNVEVMSVSRRSEKIGETASAIRVISQKDILRSGATNLAEALRLASNLQVAQLSAQHWIISARGFNSIYANKLLVLIDGRTVYSPLFAGVFWDAQSVLLEDIDRIEVISGPGSTMWGANAVNGVINIITKKTSDTQGGYIRAGTGTHIRNIAEGRYGGRLGTQGHYRVYAQHHNREPTRLPDDNPNTDAWSFSQAGFRADWTLGQNELTLIENSYRGSQKTVPEKSTILGHNLLARWRNTVTDQSALTVQLYADYTERDDKPGTIRDNLQTYDLDAQYNLSIGNHQVIAGAGYRYMVDKTVNTTPLVGFYPRNRNMDLISLFVQGEFRLAENLRLMAGSKLQHNAFSAWDLQPGIRLAFDTHADGLLWAAVSRSMRAPSRIDVDYHIPATPVPPDETSIAGGPDFVSEKLLAYEIGYRVQHSLAGLFAVSLFYHDYDDLYSVEQLPGVATFQIMNGVEGNTYGAEFTGNVVVSPAWRLSGGYTFLNKTLRNKPGNVTDAGALANLGSDAAHLVLLQNYFNVTPSLNIDVGARYVDELPATQFYPVIPSYAELNARISYQVGEFEFALAGQNLLHRYHQEFAGNKIPRNIYGTISWRP